MLFRSCDADYSVNPDAAAEYAHLTFYFLGSANEEIAVPGIDGNGTAGAVIKGGWEHIWMSHAEELDTATGTKTFTSQVNTERVYPWFNPKRLGINFTT